MKCTHAGSEAVGDDPGSRTSLPVAWRKQIQDERERIGRRLHDDVIRDLFGVGMLLESARMLIGDEPDRADERISATVDVVDHAIQRLRDCVFDLSPTSLADPALEPQAGELPSGGLPPGERASSASSLSLADHAVGKGSLPDATASDVLTVIREVLSVCSTPGDTCEVKVVACVDRGGVRLSLTGEAKVSAEEGDWDVPAPHQADALHGRLRSLPGDFSIGYESDNAMTISVAVPVDVRSP